MRRYPVAAIDVNMRYDKSQKDTHRFAIADTRGFLQLTVPVCHPQGRTWNDVAISGHGRWYQTIPVALESAYGRTPFFEFYIDRFMPLFQMQDMSVSDLCVRADAIIRKTLDLPTKIVNIDELEQYDDLRNFKFNSMPDTPPYWQVRALDLGFIPNLSILDLLFNLGPEADLYLEKL